MLQECHGVEDEEANLGQIGETHLRRGLAVPCKLAASIALAAISLQYDKEASLSLGTIRKSVGTVVNFMHAPEGGQHWEEPLVLLEPGECFGSHLYLLVEQICGQCNKTNTGIKTNTTHDSRI